VADALAVPGRAAARTTSAAGHHRLWELSGGRPAPPERRKSPCWAAIPLRFSLNHVCWTDILQPRRKSGFSTVTRRGLETCGRRGELFRPLRFSEATTYPRLIKILVSAISH